MVKHLIQLQWKKFVRSSYFRRSIAIKILLGFAALYFIISFLFLGTGVFFLLKDSYPDDDPLVLVNNYLVFWFLLDIVYRFFIQNLPVMNVKPLLALPIGRKTVIHYLLVKSSISFYNFLPLFFFLPFSIVLIFKGYSPLHVIPWFLAMGLIEFSVHYLNFLINKINAVFYVVLALLAGLAALQYYHIYDVTTTAGFVFNRIYEVPYAFLMPLLLLILLYRRNFAFLRQGFYLDDKITEKSQEAKTNELNWLNRFGDMAIFLKNDLRLILRNKRPKKVLLTSFLFLFYGLIFYTQDMYKDNLAMIAFASIFVTGGFLMTFGQLVPSWDSEYYKLLMSQNIPYRKYLESKWYLMVSATLLAFLLSTPYVYFGWEIFGLIAAGACFNIGLNTFIVLWSGALNRVPVELNVKAKAFSNTQGFNMTQMLMAIPKIVLPVALFFVPYFIFHNIVAGILVLAISGILGLVFRNFFLTKIESVYQKGKYKTIAAFEEKQ